MRFIEYINSAEMKAKVLNILNVVKQLDDNDQNAGLFGKKNNKREMLSFFNDLYQALPDIELEKRMQDIDKYQEPLDLYHKFNSGGHPVRDYLILKNNGLL